MSYGAEPVTSHEASCRCCLSARFARSASTERLDHMYDVAVIEPAVEREGLFAVDENPHVRPHLVLLVDHAEANSGILPVEITEHLGERATEGSHLLAVGIRE
jgi:hypothetical protein